MEAEAEAASFKKLEAEALHAEAEAEAEAIENSPLPHHWERPLECLQDAKLPLLTHYDTKKRITFNVISNTVSYVILQYFTATRWISKVCPCYPCTPILRLKKLISLRIVLNAVDHDILRHFSDF